MDEGQRFSGGADKMEGGVTVGALGKWLRDAWCLSVRGTGKL